jgi:hypothetical protein
MGLFPPTGGDGAKNMKNILSLLSVYLCSDPRPNQGSGRILCCEVKLQFLKATELAGPYITLQNDGTVYLIFNILFCVA